MIIFTRNAVFIIYFILRVKGALINISSYHNGIGIFMIIKRWFFDSFQRGYFFISLYV